MSSAEDALLPSWHLALFQYWLGLYHCLTGGTYSGLRARVVSAPARLQIYCLALHLRLWTAPHYRSGTFQNDLLKNLRNVAVPKTGVPLSLVCISRLVHMVYKCDILRCNLAGDAVLLERC